MTSRVIAALDTAERARAKTWIEAIGDGAGLFKLGLEFFLAHGPDAVRALGPARIFLDLKLHDIPATVRGATASVARLAPAMLTVHASGGAAMVAAAREALDAAGVPTRLLAVTVLTSLDAAALRDTGVTDASAAQVLRLGRLAIAAGAHGLVCSPLEVAGLRAALGPDPVLVVPGVRPPGSAADDQARIATPQDAIAAGADWIVVGRPITRAPDPGAAARAITASIPPR